MTVKYHILQTGCTQNITVVKAYILNLKAGWNYISIPVEPIDNSIKTVLSSIWNYVESVWSYQNGKWLSWVTAWDSGDLTKIISEYGYQIKLTQDANLTVAGIPNTDKISLIIGWNFVGLRSYYVSMFDNYTVPLDYSIVSVAEQIWGTDPAKYKCVPIDADVSCVDLLITASKLHGYWINVKYTKIINNDFEEIGGWSVEKIGNSSAPTVNLQASDVPYSGKYYLRIDNVLGNKGVERAAFVRQTITIPLSASALNYAIKYWKDVWGASLGVKIGNTIIDSISTGGQVQSSGWVMRSKDITDFRGKTVVLEVFLDDRNGVWSGAADHGAWIGVDNIFTS